LSHFVGGAQATGCHCVVGGRQRGESSIVRGVERIETARVVAAATTRPPPPRRRDPVSASAPALHAPLPSAETGQIVPEHRVGSIVRTFVHHKTPKSRPRRVRPTFRSVCSTVLCLVEIRLHPGLVVRTFARQGAVHIRICLIFGSSRGTGWHRVQPGEVGCHRGGVVDSCSDRSGRARERQRECPAHKSDDYELAAAPRLCDGLGGRRAVALLLRQAGLRVSRGGRHSSCMRWATLRGYDVDAADTQVVLQSVVRAARAHLLGF